MSHDMTKADSDVVVRQLVQRTSRVFLIWLVHDTNWYALWAVSACRQVSLPACLCMGAGVYSVPDEVIDIS